MTLKQGAWCLRCGRDETQPAGEGCHNPTWHLPTLRVQTQAAQRERQAVRLPYAEDHDE